MILLAQTGEAVKVATEGSTKLMTEWGVAGVLVIVIIAASAVMIRWFQNALKDQRGEFIAAQKEMKDSFLAALKQERESCAALTLSQLQAYEKALASHHEVVKEWRKESLTESRATRDMIQLWVSRMALARATAEDEDDVDAGKIGRKKNHGAGGVA